MWGKAKDEDAEWKNTLTMSGRALEYLASDMFPRRSAVRASLSRYQAFHASRFYAGCLGAQLTCEIDHMWDA
jgi:hypothetical protein